MNKTYEFDINSLDLETKLPENIFEKRNENQLKHSKENKIINRPTKEDSIYLISINDHDISKKRILNWLKFKPYDIEMLEMMITIESDRGKWEEVNHWIEEIKKYDPDNLMIEQIKQYNIHKKEIKILIKDNEWEKVTHLCNALLKINNNDKFGIVSLARSYKGLKEYDKSKMCWDKLLHLGRLNNDDIREYSNLLYNNKEFLYLIKLLQTRINQIDENLIEIYIRSLFNVRRYSECIIYCKKILNINKNNTIGMRLLSRCFIQNGEIGRAATILESRIENGDRNVELFENLIECYLRMDRRDLVDETWTLIKNESEKNILYFLIAVEISLIFNWFSKYKKLMKYKKQDENWDKYNVKISKIALKNGFISESWKYLKLSEENEESDEVKQRIEDILRITKTQKNEIDFSEGEPKLNYTTSLAVREILRKSSERKKKLSKKVKICIVTSSLNRGGAERQVTLTTKGLIERDLDVNLIIHKNDPGKKGTYLDDLKLFKDKINILSELIPENKIRSDNKIFAEYKELLNLLNNTTKNKVYTLLDYFITDKPELVHAWQDETILTSAIAVAMTKTPILIGSARSIRPDKKSDLHIRKKPYLKECYSLILEKEWFHLTINSNAGRNSYAEWLDIDKKFIRVIHNGTDFKNMEKGIRIGPIKSEIRDLGFDKSDIIVGGIFRLEGGKRPELWIKILEKLIHEDDRIKGILIGGGKMEETIREFIKQRGLDKSIKILGEKTDIAGWLNNMDLFLFTSSTEGLPNVIIEAQGFGVPVISTNVGGVSEILIEGVTGKLIKVEQHEEISKMILETLNDGSLDKMRRDAKEKIREKFSIENMLDNTEELYKYVISTIN